MNSSESIHVDPNEHDLPGEPARSNDTMSAAFGEEWVSIPTDDTWYYVAAGAAGIAVLGVTACAIFWVRIATGLHT